MPPAAVRHLLRTTPTIALVPHRSLLYISGSQSSEFLNGILASTVLSPPKGPYFSSFLHAQGRVIHDVFVYPKKNAKGRDGYFIEYDSRPSEAPPLLSYLKQHVLRSKVKIEDVSSDYDVWAIWGSDDSRMWETSRQWTFARSGVVEPVWNSEDPWPWSRHDGEGPSLRDRRAVGLGERVLARKGDKPNQSSSHDVADSDAYTLHRILHGVPEGNIDIPPMHAFPMESNLDVMGGLDFRKGCYVGQELTVRTYYTGVLRKRILPVHITSNSGASSEGAFVHRDVKAVFREESSDPRPRIRGTGKLLSTMQGVGLALMRLEHVELAEKGILKFQVEAEEAGQRTATSTISYWWPDWWPQPDIEFS